jgi:hypothetical protein
MLSLLVKLVAYGQYLAQSLQQHADAGGTLPTGMLYFGTNDLALIVARIMRGLHLASGLQPRLVRQAARPDPVAAPRHAPVERAPRTAPRAAKRPDLPDMPTAEEIAAAVRHRPAAAVIADICRDLGILPTHPLWQEVMTVLQGHIGTFMKFTKAVERRIIAWRTEVYAAGLWPAPDAQHATACSTGPP